MSDTHLLSSGGTRVRRAGWRAIVCAVLAVASAGMTTDAISVVSAAPAVNASAYTPLGPVRITDMRTPGDFGYTVLANGLVHVQVTGRADVAVPDGATAVVVNITSTENSGRGFITAFPSGEEVPRASNLNVDLSGDVISNLATVRLGADGAFDVYATMRTRLVIDLAGVFTPVDHAVSAGRLVSRTEDAKRVVDTRETGQPALPNSTRFVDLATLGIPDDAIAVVANLGVTQSPPGFWTAYPTASASRPLASNVNIQQFGQTRNALAIVPLRAGSHGFDLYSQSGGQFIVDIVGWYTGPSAAPGTAGLFVPTSPRRLVDTRDASAGTPPAGATIDVPIPADVPIADPSAASLNITAVDALAPGFVTAYPAGQQRPIVANLNVERITGCTEGPACYAITPNAAIVRTSASGFSVFTQAGTNIVVDVNGWYLP